MTTFLRQAYLAPFPTPESRIGTWVFPREITRSAPWLLDIESRLSALRNKPVQFLWAKKDPAFGKETVLNHWKSYLDNSETERLEDASHYLQEDRPDRVTAAIARALERSAQA